MESYRENQEAVGGHVDFVFSDGEHGKRNSSLDRRLTACLAELLGSLIVPLILPPTSAFHVLVRRRSGATTIRILTVGLTYDSAC